MSGAFAAGALALLSVGSLFRAMGSRRRSALVERAGVRREDAAPVGGRPSVQMQRARWMCLLGGLAGVVVAGVPGAIVGAGGGLALAIVLRRRREAAERARLESQLADAVAAIAAGVRAGMSLVQALGYAADETPPPLGDHLRTMASRADAGRPLGELLSAWSAELRSADLRLMVAVLQMHRRSGGDLPSVLDGLASTLRDRRAGHRELRSLTAQARLSGAILGLLPIGFFAFLGVTSPDDLSAAFEAPGGRAAILVGFMLQACAFAWIRRLLRVT